MDYSEDDSKVIIPCNICKNNGIDLDYDNTHLLFKNKFGMKLYGCKHALLQFGLKKSM